MKILLRKLMSCLQRRVSVVIAAFLCILLLQLMFRFWGTSCVRFPNAPHCKSRNIVFLWCDHLKAVATSDWSSASEVSRIPLGERIFMKSLVTGLKELGYRSIVIENRKMFDELYANKSIKDKLAAVFSDVFVLGDLTKSGFFERNSNKRFFALDFWGTMHVVKDDVMVPGLPLKNYLTPYPDNLLNTFLGFVVDPCSIQSQRKERSGLIWGKRLEYWEKGWSADVYRDIVESLKVHLYATSSDQVPDIVENLSVMSRDEFIHFLPKQMFFLGLGTPHDGPSAMEVLSCGVPYINPTFGMSAEEIHARRLRLSNASIVDEADRWQRSAELFRRQSQHKFMEMFSEPHVYHVPLHDTKALLDAIRKIIDRTDKEGPIQPFIPVEYQKHVYMERLNSLLNTLQKNIQ